MATVVNARDLLLTAGSTARVTRATSEAKTATAPWNNLITTNSNLSLTNLVKSTDSVIKDPDSNLADKYTANSTLGTHSISPQIITSSLVNNHKYQAAVYIRDTATDTRAVLKIVARNSANTVSRVLAYSIRASNGTIVASQVDQGWSANKVIISNTGSGWYKVVIRGTFTVTASSESVVEVSLDVLNSSNSATYTGSNQALFIYALQGYVNQQPDELIGDIWRDTSTGSVKRWTGWFWNVESTRNYTYKQDLDPATTPGIFVTNGDTWIRTSGNGTVVLEVFQRIDNSWTSLKSSASINYLELSNAVVFKDAADAASSGNYSAISIQGKRLFGSTSSNIGFVTITANNAAEAATATDTSTTPLVFTAISTSGASSFTAKLYDSASKTTLLDTQNIPVVYRGAKGTNAITVTLSNDSHVVPADAAGLVSSYTNSGTDIYVYEDSTAFTYTTGSPNAGQFSVSVSTSSITAGSITASASGIARAIVAAHSNMTAAVGTVTYTVTAKKLDNTTVVISKQQTIAKSVKANIVIRYLELSNAVIFKDAINAATTGNHSSISLQGKQLDGSTLTNSGFVTFTAAGATEATTATDTSANPFVPTIASTAGVESFTAKLYNNSTKTTLLDTQTIPVVFKGASGSNAITAVVSNESATLPATNAGVATTYVNTGTDIFVYENTTALTYVSTITAASQFSISVTATGITAGAITASASGTNRAIVADHSNMTATTASILYTITIRRADNTTVVITKLQTFTKGLQGAQGNTGTRGSLTLSRDISGATPPDNNQWSDAQALAALSSAGAASAISGDVVTLYNSTSAFSQTRSYNGTSWSILAGFFGGDVLVDGTLTANKLKVTGAGSVINIDPNTQDRTAWFTSTAANLSIVTGITDAPGGGGSVLQSAAGISVPLFTNEFLPIEQTANYLLKYSVKQSSGATLGSYQIGIAWYDAGRTLLTSSVIAPAGWTNGTYSVFETVTATTSWVGRSFSFGPDFTAKIPSSARFFRVYINLNSGSTAAAVLQATNIKLLTKVEADLIVDGTISAQKINSRGLDILDAAGNVILSAGTSRNSTAGNLLQNSSFEKIGLSNLATFWITSISGTTAQVQTPTLSNPSNLGIQGGLVEQRMDTIAITRRSGSAMGFGQINIPAAHLIGETVTFSVYAEGTTGFNLDLICQNYDSAGNIIGTQTQRITDPLSTTMTRYSISHIVAANTSTIRVYARLRSKDIGLAATTASSTATTATIGFATQASAPYAIGSTIEVNLSTIGGVANTTLNGLKTVTACTTTSVSFANSTSIASAAAVGTTAQAVAAYFAIDDAQLEIGNVATVYKVSNRDKLGLDNPITNSNASTYIADAAIGDAQIGGIIKSTDFNGSFNANGTINSIGTTGWAINKAGGAILDAAAIRGQLVASQINSSGLNIKDSNGNIILSSGKGAISQGSTLTENPAMTDPSAWVHGAHGTVDANGLSATPVTVADGPISTVAYRTPTNASGSVESARGVAVVANRTYRISALVRNVGGNGLFYLRYTYRNPTTGALLGQGFGGVEGVSVPQGGWQRYTIDFSVRQGHNLISPRAILNWTGTTGYMEIQDLKIESPYPEEYDLARYNVGGGNLLNTASWGDPIEPGTLTGFGAIGNANENAIVWNATPDGAQRVVWRATSQDAINQPDNPQSPDGGWETASFTIDRTKLYRFSVWVWLGGTMDGSMYLGCAPSSVRAPEAVNNPVNTNPYFISRTRTTLSPGWYLLVGHVHPNTSATTTRADTGIYDAATGRRIEGGQDWAWTNTATTSLHRAYLYYASAGALQDFLWPRVEVVDGSEPNIAQLLTSRPPARITPANASTYIADAAIGNAQIGGTIQSDNYVAGSSGWAIRKDGNGFAEFQNVKVRGDVEAKSLNGVDIVSADHVVLNTLTKPIFSSAAAGSNGTGAFKVILSASFVNPSAFGAGETILCGATIRQSFASRPRAWHFRLRVTFPGSDIILAECSGTDPGDSVALSSGYNFPTIALSCTVYVEWNGEPGVDVFERNLWAMRFRR